MSAHPTEGERRRSAPKRAWAATVLVLTLVACGKGGTIAATVSPSTDGSAGASAEASAPARPSSAGGPSGPSVVPGSLAPGEFQNPVIDRNFADPFVLRVGDTYYGYATGNLTYNIQVTSSPDLVNWERVREALPRLPLWQPTSKGLTWAPEVVEIDGRFVMHYTARDVQAGRQCLAIAVADEPEGPFVDDTNEPLLCQYDLGGSIDSSPFLDADGTRYLLWKSDGNCCGIPVRMFIAELAADGRSLAGPATDLGLAVDAPWERTLIEAPTLLLLDGTYYLFFSANDYNSRNYAVGYATAGNASGPFTDAEENPILASDPPVGVAGLPAGPGHQSVVADGTGDLWMVYHAWDSGLIGDQLGGRRALWIDELTFDGGRPVVHGPDHLSQAAPALP